MTLEQERLLRRAGDHDGPPAGPGADVAVGVYTGAGSSVWRVAQQPLGLQRRGRYVEESGAHPGRMAPALAAEAIRRYTRPGDLVLDPMCGIGTTLVEAVHADRDAYGMDCEPRWTATARANLALAARQGATGHADVETGDARQSRSLPPRRARLVLTSPPYGPSPHGRVEVPGGPDRGPVVSHLNDTYTSDAPSWSGTSGPVNLAHANPARLQAGLTDILTATTSWLTQDGVIVVVARPWRADGLLIDLPGMVTAAAEAAGLHVADRCVALLASERPNAQLTPRHSFHQLWHVRRARDRGDDWLLIAHEDVLVLRHGPTP